MSPATLLESSFPTRSEKEGCHQPLLTEFLLEIPTEKFKITAHESRRGRECDVERPDRDRYTHYPTDNLVVDLVCGYEMRANSQNTVGRLARWKHAGDT